MKKFQVYGFRYIFDGSINVLSGTKEECENEIKIPCFDGIAFFRSLGKCYKMTYPKMRSLSWDDKKMIKDTCGDWADKGEYGWVCMTFGKVEQISDAEFESLISPYSFPIRLHYQFDGQRVVKSIEFDFNFDGNHTHHVVLDYTEDDGFILTNEELHKEDNGSWNIATLKGGGTWDFQLFGTDDEAEVILRVPMRMQANLREGYHSTPTWIYDQSAFSNVVVHFTDGTSLSVELSA